MPRRTVVTAPPRFESKNPRQWLAQISCYYDSLAFEDVERLEDVSALLTGWNLMFARFSVRTVGSTIENYRDCGIMEILNY